MSLREPPSAYAVHLVGPGRPCLVRIWITPFAASVPYSAAADGPFTTSTDSQSSGFRSLRRDGAWPPEAPRPPSALGTLSTRTPSTTMIGSLRSDRLVAPRIRMRDPVPVVPAALQHLHAGNARVEQVRGVHRRRFLRDLGGVDSPDIAAALPLELLLPRRRDNNDVQRHSRRGERKVRGGG